jgi:hypothetical protein
VLAGREVTEVVVEATMSSKVEKSFVRRISVGAWIAWARRVDVTLLRRMRVTTRLVAGFLLLALCVVAIWIAAVWSADSTRSTARALARSEAKLDAVQQLKFRVTDVSGWQAGYAFNIVRKAPDAAADTAPERAPFLASMKSFVNELDELAALPLTTAEQADVSTIRTGFQKFQNMDDEVIAAYRAGTRAATDRLPVHHRLGPERAGRHHRRVEPLHQPVDDQLGGHRGEHRDHLLRCADHEGVIDIQHATQELSQLSNELRVLVGQFRV